MHHTDKVTRIHSAQVKVLPHFLEEAIIVPPVMCADGHAVRDARDDVELLDGDLINFVEHIKRRNVDSVVCMALWISCEAQHCRCIKNEPESEWSVH